jgi:hypothetical protein
MYKILGAVLIALAAGACSVAQEPSPTPFIAAIDQQCADTASTGDSYRYCVDLALEQAGLPDPDHVGGASSLAFRAD